MPTLTVLTSPLLAQGSEVTAVFVQYSALGVIALLALGAVRVLFQRETKSLDLERARADRLEEELRKLNTAITERYVQTLTQATQAISEALEVTQRDRR